MPVAEPAYPRASKETIRGRVLDVKHALEERESQVFERILIEHAERINEGNNGVIFALRLQDMGVEEKTLLLRKGIIDEEETSRVVKLLKLSAPGKLRKEFQLSKKGWDVVRAKRKNAPAVAYAGIPEPRYYEEIRISPALRTSFLEMHDVTYEGDTAEIMVMDQIEGVDLDTILLRELLIQHPNSPFLKKKKQLEECSYGELFSFAARVLGHSLPEETNQAKWNREDWLLYSRFRKDLETYLQHCGFRIDERLLGAIEWTIRALHDEGIVWADGNLRNIMIEGNCAEDSDGSVLGSAWVLDFGGAELEQDLEHPEEMKKQVYATLHKLKRLFGSRKQDVTVRDTRLEKMVVEQERKITMGGRAVDAFAAALTPEFESHEVLPLPVVIDRFRKAMDWAEYLGPVLYRLASRDEQSRQKILRSIHFWIESKDHAALTHPRVQSALSRLLQVLEK